MVTWLAYFARCRAACPAEFPPPTTNTGLPGHCLGFVGAGTVEHPGTEQRLQPRDLQAPVGHAGGDDHCPGPDLAAVFQPHHAQSFVGCQPRGRVAVDEVRAEPPCLLVGPPGQFHAADPAREPQIVPDPRAGPSLAAERLRLHQRGGKPFRGSIHRGGQTRRPSAHDGHIVGMRGGPHVEAERLGHLGVARIHQDDAVVQRHHRPGRLGHTQPLQHLAAFVGVTGVEAERHAGAVQNVADLVGTWLRADSPSPITVTASNRPPCSRHHSSSDSVTARWNCSSGDQAGLGR